VPNAKTGIGVIQRLVLEKNEDNDEADEVWNIASKIVPFEFLLVTFNYPYHTSYNFVPHPYNYNPSVFFTYSE